MAPRKAPRRWTRRDKHRLYELSVQDPEHDIRLMTRIYRKESGGRTALRLREDFCGTGLLCSTWVRSHPEQTATGIDLDRGVLAFARRNNVAPLGDDAERVTLLRQDVRDPVKGRFDLAVAFNYSYFIFRDRKTMVGYFRSVRRSLAPGGLFFMDAYGGSQAMEELVERRRIDGFTYVWEQESFDPIDAAVVNRIHFRLPGGERFDRAFTYRWRLWTLPELRELLEEAGFSRVDVYGEDEDADGDHTGIYRRRKHLPNDPAWIVYLCAHR